MISKKPQYMPPDECDLEIFEATVPANHYLRQVNAIIDFERCHEELNEGGWNVSLRKSAAARC